MYLMKLAPTNAVGVNPIDQELLNALERITALADFEVYCSEGAEAEAAIFDRIGGGALLYKDLTTGACQLYSPKKTIAENIIKAAAEIERIEAALRSHPPLTDKEVEAIINEKAVPATSGL